MATRVRALIGAAVVIALASIASTPMLAQSQGGGRETFTLKAVRGTETDVDVNSDGDTDDAGDFFVGTSPLVRNGRKQGSERHICTALKSSEAAALLRCEGTFNIEGRGSLEIAGVLKFSRRGAESTFSIVGGTADFRGAGGTVKFEGRRNSEVFTFKVTR